MPGLRKAGFANCAGSAVDLLLRAVPALNGIASKVTMLTIRSSQQAALAAERTALFEQTLLRHVETAYPAESAKWGEARTAEFVNRSLRRAMGHGIDTTGAVVTFVELLVQFGEQFGESPDGEKALEILDEPAYPGQIKIQLLVECLMTRIGGRRIVAAE